MESDGGNSNQIRADSEEEEKREAMAGMLGDITSRKGITKAAY